MGDQNCIPPKRATHEPLPAPAVNAARRMVQLAQTDSFHDIKLLVHGRVWFMVVDNGKPERLGEDKG